jgi:hypothetical protein
MSSASSARGPFVHPSTSPQVESRLAARHLSFTFEPNLEIDRVREVEGNQVRLIEHRAPKATVDRYVQQTKAGAVFPAIVVNGRYELVDGNTRLMAARQLGRATIAAYVCADLSALQARSLSVELNQSHGLSMTEAEIHAFVTSAVEEGQRLDARAYSRMTGVKASTLARWVAAKHFEIRAARCGVAGERLRELSESARAALQVAKLKAVFLEITALALEARVPASQLRRIITAANGAPSEIAALEIVAQARELWSDDARAIAAGFKVAPRRSAGSALHIGGLLRFAVADLLDVAPERQPETFRRMALLKRRLETVLAQAGGQWSLHPLEESSDATDDPTHKLAQVN